MAVTVEKHSGACKCGVSVWGGHLYRTRAVKVSNWLLYDENACCGPKMLENESGCWYWATLVALVFVYCLCVPLSLSLFVLITWFSLSESQAV